MDHRNVSGRSDHRHVSLLQHASSDRKQLACGQCSRPRPVRQALVSVFSSKGYTPAQGAACASLGRRSQRHLAAADWQGAAATEAAVSVQRVLSGGGAQLDVASCGMFVPRDAQPAASWLSAMVIKSSPRCRCLGLTAGVRCCSQCSARLSVNSNPFSAAGHLWRAFAPPQTAAAAWQLVGCS
jgi:hypothetical protein